MNEREMLEKQEKEIAKARKEEKIVVSVIIGVFIMLSPFFIVGITKFLNHYFVPYDDLCLLIKNTIQPKVLDRQLGERCYKGKRND